MARLLLEITSVLFVPVVGLLLLFLSATIVYLGGIIAEAFMRARSASATKALVERFKSEPNKHINSDELAQTHGLIGIAAGKLQQTPHAAAKIMDDMQLRTERKLGYLSLGIRLGPILGLAGTLIPLGPALMALSNGNVQALSEQLIVAFATTVIGLIVSGCCYAIHSIRSKWYSQDLSDLEYLLSRWGHEKS